MKLNDLKRLVWVVAVVMIIAAMAYTNRAKADDSYGLTNNPTAGFVKAEEVTVSAEKVMDGISDIIVTTKAGSRTDKFILQCDSSTETGTVFYYVQTPEGVKAVNATGMSIQFYRNDAPKPQTQKEVGRRFTYITTQDHNSLRDGLNALPEIQGDGFWVLHFFRTVTGSEKTPIAWSMGIEPKVAQEMLDKLDTIKDGSDCSYHSEFNSLFALKNLNDQF